MRQVVSTAVLLVLLAPRAHGQDQPPLAHIRDLYSNAAYEEVLSALAVDNAPPPPELGQYKVFSLIALGRTAEADKAAEAVIIANPRFQPDPDASPRVLELFASVRRRIAPELLKSMYLNAKAALDQKDRDGAIRAFGEIVAVADNPDLKDDAVVGELRLLASGFLELSRALPTAPPAPSVDKPATPPAPASPPPANPAPEPASTPKVTLPVPITETMPRWIPAEAFAHREFRGRILIRIDADGSVVSSEILMPTTPLYDAELLQASKQWRYKPAVSNGVAVASERIVEIVLKPR
jgi:hypothetical protein